MPLVLSNYSSVFTARIFTDITEHSYSPCTVNTLFREHIQGMVMDKGESNEQAHKRTQEIYKRLTAVGAKRWESTAVQETRDLHDPFRTVISSMLSARTREEDTRRATHNLFAPAQTPQEMLALPDEQIEKAIRMTTYWENKVRYVRGLCAQLVQEHHGEVPRTLDALTALPGVGWKTATLTQWIAFGIA
ncbi:MAG: hypothetical protein KC496_09485, partial [Anaerolineae bacterium]|nr:hypothetical protein [Anaerolineae bacterium]